MYYAFFETGDEEFFSDLMKAFCSTYVHNIVDLYNAVKQKKSNILETERYVLDWKDLVQHLDEERKTRLNIFNCSQHLKTAECPNNTCKAGHTAVLAKNQHDQFEHSMVNAKNTYCRIHYPGGKKKVWLIIQRIFNYYDLFEIFKLKTLNFAVNDPAKYLERYIEETNKLCPAGGYAYVRSASNNSDFPKFQTGTTLPKVAPCNTLQTVL